MILISYIKDRLGIGFGLLGVILGFSTCQPTPQETDLVKEMMVQTGVESTTNFSSYATYSLPTDTVGYIYTEDLTDSLFTGEYGSAINRQIKLNLDNAGYVRVGNKQNPDLGIYVFVAQNFGVFQPLAYPGLYGSYSGYYNPNYYGFKNFYGYPYLNSISLNTATLVIEIIDLKNKDSQGNSKLLWAAYVGDLLNTPDLFVKTMTGIDQSFAQSKYIKK